MLRSGIPNITPILDSNEEQAPHVDLKHEKLNKVGIYFQYFFIGFVYTLSNDLTYEFFRSYLGIDGAMCNMTVAIIGIPWTLKVIFGLITECFRFRNYRRKPSMLIGWVGSFIVGIIIFYLPFPKSRFFSDKPYSTSGCSGAWQNKTLNAIDGIKDKDYDLIAMKYAVLLLMYNFFIVLIDVAMDGLLIDYTRLYHSKNDSRFHFYIYSTRHFGFLLTALVKAFGLNWFKYAGPWCFGVEVHYIFIAMIAVPIIAIPVIIFLTQEIDSSIHPNQTSEVFHLAWMLLTEKVVQKYIIFGIAFNILQNLISPAEVMVLSEWIKMSSIVYNIFDVAFGNILFLLGTLIFAKIVSVDWRLTYFVSYLFIISIRFLSIILAALNIIRNQYLYVLQRTLPHLAMGTNYVSGLLIIEELKDSNADTVIFSQISTTNNIGIIFGRVLVNLLVLPFKVSSVTRYSSDAKKDRLAVVYQAGLIITIQLVFLIFLKLLPSKSVVARAQKLTTGDSNCFAITLIVLLILMLIFSCSISLSWPYIAPKLLVLWNKIYK